MRRDRILLGILVVAWVACFGLGLRSGLGPRCVAPVGVRADPAGGYPIVLGFSPEVGPEDTAVEPGDRLVEVAGADLRGLGALGFYAQYVARARPGEPSRATFERNGQRSETRMPEPALMPMWPYHLVSLGFFAVAIVLLRRGPPNLPDAVPRAFLLVAIGCLCPPTGGVAVNYAGLAVGAGVWAVQFPLCLRALLTFPGKAAPKGAWARWLPWLFAPMGLFCVNAVSGFPFRRNVGIVLWLLGTLAFLAVTLAVVAGIYRRADAILRRQFRVAALGFWAALLPTIGALLLVLVERPWFGAPIGSYALLWQSFAFAVLIPIAILIAIVRYNLFDIDRLLSAAASYNIVLVALVGSGLVAVPRLAEFLSAWFGLDRRAGLITVSLLLAAIAVPAHQWLRLRIDRVFFKERHALEQGVSDLLRSLSTCEDAQALARCAGEELHRLLRPKLCAVYTRSNGEIFVPAFVATGAELPAFEARSPLVATLRERGRPLSLSAAGRRPEVGALGSFDRAVLEALEAEVVVPVVRGETLAAFICLGPKRSGDVYTPTDLAHLGSVAETLASQLRRLEREDEPASLPQVFRREGDVWAIAYAGKEIRLRDMRGLHYLSQLLRQPGREVHASELVRLGGGGSAPAPGVVHGDPELHIVRGLGSAAERLDTKAKAAYRARLEDLDAEEVEAERANNLGRLERVREEKDTLIAELAAAAGGKRVDSAAERARLTATKGIKAALDKIAARHSELGAHLQATVKRGYVCVYTPDPRHPIDWET